MYDLAVIKKINGPVDPDFEAFKAEIGITEDELIAARKRLNVHPHPLERYVRIGDSEIHGVGVFSAIPLAHGEPVAVLRIGRRWTVAGLTVNHSRDPNTAPWMGRDDYLWAIALRPIKTGEEITMNYRKI